MLFISLIMDNSPQTHIPTLVAGSSSKIKVWGLQTYASKGVLILNKDTNTSLDGHVKVYVQSGKS